MSNGFVRLKLATLGLGSGGGQLVSSFNVWVRVRNVAYVKDVQLHFRQQFGGVWQDQPLTWKKTYGTYDLFALEPALNFQGNAFVEFAIRFVSGGTTYWDNNDNLNYTLTPTVPALTSDTGTLRSASLIFSGPAGSSRTAGISGEILVNNHFYHKNVGIRHSNDGWLSYMEVPASHQQSLAGLVEHWRFVVNGPPQGFGRGEFAVFCQNSETGQFFWDNNFGQNYDLRQLYELQ